MYLVTFEYNKRGKPGEGIITKVKTLRKVNTIEEAKKFTSRFKHIDEKKYKDWCFRYTKIDN